MTDDLFYIIEGLLFLPLVLLAGASKGVDGLLRRPKSERAQRYDARMREVSWWRTSQVLRD